MENAMSLCECGCGEQTTSATARYLTGHHLRKSPLEYIVDADGCWIWQRSQDGHGYGTACLPGQRRVKAHRMVYEREVGPIPAGLDLDHLCRTPLCVNPAHLEPVTRRENVARSRCVRIPESVVAAIRAASGSYRAIGRHFGVDHTHVRAIKLGLARQPRNEGVDGR
jgi:hypothetical protein